MSEIQQHEKWETAVQEAIRSLRFGSVVVVVHEGKVTQIEKREKIRPEDGAASRAAKSVGAGTSTESTLNGRPQ
jgi:hypothetical protein